MTTIRTIDLNKKTVISNRDVSVSRYQYGIDINRIDGSYLVVEPLNEDNSYGGRVVIYAQDGTITYYNTFNRVGSLYYPTDAKIDYIRSKMWIADAGNNRVLKIDIKTNNADININENLYYPHSIVVDVNTGNIFIKGYSGNDLNYGKISYYRWNGVLLGEFIYNHAEIDSSTSSNSSDLSTQSSESIVIPSLPSNRSMCFDSVRSKLWWVDGNKVYVLDVRNKQIQSLDISVGACNGAIGLDVEYKTGNIYVIANCDISAVLEINKENNSVVGVAYLEEYSSSSSSSSNLYSSTSSSEGDYIWTRRILGVGGWMSLTSSDTGQYLVAGCHSSFGGSGYIYTSNNYGVNWISQTQPGIGVWNGLASSIDGSKVIASKTNYPMSSASDTPYISTDYGVNWIQRTLGAGSWATFGVCSDNNFTKLAVVTRSSLDGYIYTSTDSGVNWTKQTGSGNRSWRVISSSSDGSKLYAAGDNTYIYSSTDSGVTWNALTSAGQRNWNGLACSKDGMYVYGANGNASGYIYKSSDYGSTWTSTISAGSRNWFGMVCSYDGRVVTSCVYGGYIYISENYGVSFIQQPVPSRTWRALCSNENGDRIASGPFDEIDIWTGVFPV